MGLGTLAVRSNGQTIDDTWYNVLRTAIIQDLLARNASGVVGDVEGSLGTSTVRWLTAYLASLKLSTATKQITISPPSGLAANYAVEMPGALPASTLPLSLSNAGVLTAAQIVTAQIALLNITTALLDNLSVTGAKIAAATITPDKIAALGQQVSGEIAITTTLDDTDLTGASVSIPTTGRPVFIGLQNTTDVNTFFSCSSGVKPKLFRDATLINKFTCLSGVSPVNIPASSFWFIDVVAAGTYTYKFTSGELASYGGGTLSIDGLKMIAFEIV